MARQWQKTTNMVINNCPLRILLLIAVVQCCAGFGFHPGSRTLVPSHGMCKPHARHQLSRRHLSGDDDDGDDDGEKEKETDDTDDGDSYTWDELQADPELRKLEFDSSMNRKNKILLPQRISEAVTTLGWSFVIGGFILNTVGFAWVKNPSGGIGIGTLDERDFQREIMREGRRKDEGEKKPTLSISRTEIVNKHLFSWIEEQQQNSRSA
mmetsp:Transcript_25672/g.47210  ORF Transcript_25672/g.47210 Transcript_25672/m.47210 type:complete len:210 (-) Transcript_25672:120-749(-)